MPYVVLNLFKVYNKNTRKKSIDYTLYINLVFLFETLNLLRKKFTKINNRQPPHITKYDLFG